MVQGIGGIGANGLTPVGVPGGVSQDLAGSSGVSFGDTLKQAIGEVSQAQDAASSAVEAFLRGDAVELHEVMAATEEAGIALEMLIEIRNKFTEAYRTVLHMQS